MSCTAISSCTPIGKCKLTSSKHAIDCRKSLRVIRVCAEGRRTLDPVVVAEYFDHELTGVVYSTLQLTDGDGGLIPQAEGAILDSLRIVSYLGRPVLELAFPSTAIFADRSL
jgi:hypothetical protein